MEKKVIDLEVVDDLLESGTQKISLVDSPAIEKDWMYFKKLEFVEPNSGESESDYMGRCVPVLIDEGKDQDQAVAICISTYQNMAAMEFAKVSFDFDDTLSTEEGLKLATEYKDKGDTLYIISARNEVSSGMLERADALGIPKDRVFATGSNKAKVEKVKELQIDKHIDNNADVIADLGSIGIKFGIDTGGLAPYTQQTGNKEDEDDLVTKAVNFNSILSKAKDLGFSAEDFTTNGLAYHEDVEGIDLKLAKGYTVYKYTGSVGSDTREFCRDMVSMNRFYTFDEINQLSDSNPNPGFGLGGSDNYSLWKYKGGPNCKHRWTKFYVTETGDIENKGGAPGIAGEKPDDMPNHGYAFASEDKRELVGAVAIPDMEIPRKDKDGNIFFVRFSKAVIEKMARKFMREQRLADNNIQHMEDMDAGSYVYESWIVENPEDKANTIYGLNVPVGTWVVKMKVLNDETWKKVKEGKLNGFSLEGSFLSKEEYTAYLEDKKMYESLVDLVNSL
jgi:hypothetical protein